MFGNNRHQSNLGERVNERIANLFSRLKVTRYSLYDKAKDLITNLWNTTDFFPVRNAREYTRERHVIQYDNVYYSRFVFQGVNKLLSEAHYLSHTPYRIPIRLNSKAEFDRHDYKAEFSAYLDRNPTFLRSKIEEKK